MKIMVTEIKNLSIEEYLSKIKPYLKDIKLIFKNHTHGNFT